MIKNIISQVINSIVSQVINSIVAQITVALKLNTKTHISDLIKNTLWNTTVQEAINATEDIDEEIGKFIFTSSSIQNLKKQLFNGKTDNIHKKIVLTLAMELRNLHQEKDFLISLGTAVVDKWLEKNTLSADYDTYNVQELRDIINNPENLYRNYFKLFEDKNGADLIKVLYPKNGENYIRYNDAYSVTIKVNLSKGLEYGFIRRGFDYCQLLSNNKVTLLQVTFIEDEKELLRFNTLSADKYNKTIWIR